MGKRLCDETIKLARDSGKTTQELATMAGASHSWAKMLIAGYIKSPGCEHIQNLYEALTGKPLIPGA